MDYYNDNLQILVDFTICKCSNKECNKQYVLLAVIGNMVIPQIPTHCPYCKLEQERNAIKKQVNEPKKIASTVKKDVIKNVKPKKQVETIKIEEKEEEEEDNEDLDEEDSITVENSYKEEIFEEDSFTADCFKCTNTMNRLSVTDDYYCNECGWNTKREDE